ncbi:protein CLEC16A homolog [Leptopilina heterotoma]|uniref:protein CLEC16A homolog n=1 Tax=Leptopilina heterotoma TaxID=63436 RepID=UPI001CA87B67|nr:protein CLEC16A homolog [Leptopilina heterotoma]
MIAMTGSKKYTVPKVQKIWADLKSDFDEQRERNKKYTPSGSEAPDEYPPFVYYKAMNFLEKSSDYREIISSQHKRTVSRDQSDSDEDDDNDNNRNNQFDNCNFEDIENNNDDSSNVQPIIESEEESENTPGLSQVEDRLRRYEEENDLFICFEDMFNCISKKNQPMCFFTIKNIIIQKRQQRIT